MERSHLLLIIEDADTEKTQRDEATDEDNDEDDGVLLAVQIWSGKENFLLLTFHPIKDLHLCILLDNPEHCWVPCLVSLVSTALRTVNRGDETQYLRTDITL